MGFAFISWNLIHVWCGKVLSILIINYINTRRSDHAMFTFHLRCTCDYHFSQILPATQGNPTTAVRFFGIVRRYDDIYNQELNFPIFSLHPPLSRPRRVTVLSSYGRLQAFCDGCKHPKRHTVITRNLTSVPRVVVQWMYGIAHMLWCRQGVLKVFSR